MGLLTREDSDRIAKTIASVEETTAGELVVVVVSRSDPYAFPRAVGALCFAIAAAWIAYLRFPLLDSAWFFGAQAPLWALGYWALGWPPLLRLVVPRSVQQAAVAAKAKEVFLHQGVTETRDRSGVLLLLSETEHRVHLLADRGIHARVGVDGWQEHVSTIVHAIRDRRTADGLCQALESIGAVLQESFPARPDDTNELANEVRRAD